MKTRPKTNKTGWLPSTHALATGSYNGLGILRYLKSPLKVRYFLGMSQAQLCKELTRLTKERLTPGAVKHWEHARRPMERRYTDAYATLVANKLTRDMNRMIGVNLEVNSPWKFVAYGQCACGRWYRLRSVRHVHCGKCGQ